MHSQPQIIDHATRLSGQETIPQPLLYLDNAVADTTSLLRALLFPYP